MKRSRQQEIRKQIRKEQRKPSPEEVIEARSRIARQRIDDENAKNGKKSRFDYLTITMAVLMAAITLIGVVIYVLILWYFF
ncbi:MAG: DUF4044 domain-containing protein [Oenococcus sp.]|uniref:DUF4044 domain-containing protein n=1 Tax=Oenococcus sp. TaxID=1979414 RepID=UPI0039E87601